MERVVKVFPAKNWAYVQVGLLAFVGLFMGWFLWEAWRSGHDWNDVFLLLLPGSICWYGYRGARKSTAKAETDWERIVANEHFTQLALAVIALLGLCVSILRSFHCG